MRHQFVARFVCASAVILGGLASQQEIVNLGGGLAGVSGIPSMSVSGDLLLNENVVVNLTNAAPNSVAWLAVGLTTVYLPLFGGILVPYPDVSVQISTDSQGKGTHTFACPDYENAMYAQFMVADAGAVEGFSFSNTMMLVPGIQTYVSNKQTVGATPPVVVTCDVNGTEARTYRVRVTRGGVAHWDNSEQTLQTPTAQAFVIPLNQALLAGDSVEVIGQTTGKRATQYSASLVL
jgi:hypothetical protein